MKKAAFLAVALSACLQGPGGGSGGPSGLLPDDKFAVIRVHYLTDRARSGREGPRGFYSGERGDPEFGRALVSIPRHHKTGEIEEPPWYVPRGFADPDQYILILNLTPMDRALAVEDIANAVALSEDRGLFVFVHGFNVSFDEALRRTAQLSWDLGFPGAPVTFSWPSEGDLTPLGYTADGNDADWAAAHLAEFLGLAQDEFGAERVHVVAHSMGSRVLTEAMIMLAREGVTMPQLNQVVLTAPDIDAQIFERDIYSMIRGTTEKMALYISSEDNALQMSRLIAGGYPRLGDPTDGVVVLDGLETIDASEIDGGGHSYFAETVEAIADLRGLVREGLPPESRRLVRVDDAPGGFYWRIPR